MNRRSFLTGLIATPAVIAADRLMPIKLWVPTIYGDAVHDDWEGLMAWTRGERVNILPPQIIRNLMQPGMKHGVIGIGRPFATVITEKRPFGKVEVKSVYYRN